MIEKINPNYVLAKYRLWRGDWRGAAEFYGRLSRQYPRNTNLQTKYITTLFRAKQYERVVSLVADTTEYIDMARLKANALLRLGNHSGAVELLNGFLKAFPDDYRLNKIKADALLAEGYYGEALSTYLDAINMNGADVSYCEHAVGYIYEKQGKHQEADKHYTIALRNTPNAAVAVLGIGTLHQMRGFYDEAIRAYQAQLESNPQNAEIFFRLGSIYSKQAKTKAAAEAYKKFVECDKQRRPLNEKMVVFDAYMGRNYACSPRAIYEEMLKDKRFKDFTFVWAMRSSSLTRYWQLYLNRRTRVVKYKSRDYFRYYAEAKYWVTNSRIAFVMKTNPNQVYIQCWHGTPLKRMGHSVVDGHTGSKYDKDGLAELYDHEAKRFDYLISPSKKYTEYMSDAFNLKQLGKEGIVIETGYPRNDFLHNFTQRDVARAKQMLRIPADKKVLLYAPTWRDDQRDSERGYTYKTQVDFDYLRKKLGDDWVILFRAHYFVANLFDFNKYKGFIYNVSDVNDVNDLYIVSDALMTDYSSVFFDYANLHRPIIFFMYDLDHYRENIRGFYFDLGVLPGDIVKTEEQVSSILHDLSSYQKRLQEKYTAFNNTYNYLDDGRAAERVTRVIQ